MNPKLKKLKNDKISKNKKNKNSLSRDPLGVNIVASYGWPPWGRVPPIKSTPSKFALHTSLMGSGTLYLF